MWCWCRFRPPTSRGRRSGPRSSCPEAAITPAGAISSSWRSPQVRQPLGFGEALVADWQVAGLIKPSVLKPVFTTIDQGLVVRTMGALSANDLRSLREVIGQVIG